MPIGGAIAAVGSVAGGALAANASAKGAKKSAQAISDASDQATALQRETYYDQRALLAPSISAGAQARARQMLMQGIPREQVIAYLRSTNSAINQGAPGTETRTTPDRYLRGENGLEFVPGQTYGGETIDAQPGEDYSWVDDWSWESSSPSYQFRFDEGQRALERSKAAGGDYFSGDTATALQRYGQDYASNEWEADWRRFGDLAGDGQQSTGTTVQVAGQFGNNAAQNTMTAGQARATGYQQAGNAWGNFWQGAAGIPMYAYGQGWLGGKG